MDKPTRDALERVLQCRIDQNNYGMMHHTTPSFHDMSALHNAAIKIEGDTITEDGKPVLHIVRRYANQKHDGMYKELKPKLEPIPEPGALMPPGQ